MKHIIEVSADTKALLDHNRGDGETDEQVIVQSLTAPNPAVHVIAFILENHFNLDEPMTFLKLWNEGEFDTLREEWADLDLPDEIFIGADTQFVPKD